MGARRRLTPERRRDELLDAAARLFATRPYDEVLMEDVAEHAGVSRANLYRYFPSKRDLFAAIYRRAADDLLAAVRVDPAEPVIEQVSAGLDAHIDYFVANRLTVLAANRVLAGDPMIQAIISDEMAQLRQRILESAELSGIRRDVAAPALHAWLVFVRAICVEWLANETFSREELREVCLGALRGALDAAADADRS
ncbi:DNA-binding transcriptional regulator, AcrR family [Amycolatopsis arida]|uniref:DNA-binding transcriptional regulator, AcrR family n=1 Tax=Amycolatopsis arida TaxID=587909 RepID=A0A1I5MAI7_9PSEU|nr:TetR/AcrR family transcriptional regulator [Amycolatopsis arida]TDX94027.1 AcrR family transcriptional regulator [Amycolatopsis arida]SFP06510.1 DNA-binding transcriptional regulator, AcrR family [Amycolatopsis arida]